MLFIILKSRQLYFKVNKVVVNNFTNIHERYINIPKKVFTKLESMTEKYLFLKKKLENNIKTIDQIKINQLNKDINKISTSAKIYIKLKKLFKEKKDLSNLYIKEPDITELINEDILEVNKKIDLTNLELIDSLIPNNQNSNKNVILEIRASSGGLEASIFASDILKMYKIYALNKGWKIKIVNSIRNDLGGLREIVMQIKGKNVYRYLKYESGCHRVQRVPTTDRSGRIHTSTVTVIVLVEATNEDINISNKDIKIDVFRAQGAGGQHVNKTNSAVRITYIPLNIVISCQNQRSQHQNKAEAMKVLRSKLMNINKNEFEKEINNNRSKQIGSGNRYERIRTYNWIQDRITDHRIGKNYIGIKKMMSGGYMNKIVDELEINERMKVIEGF